MICEVFIIYNFNENISRWDTVMLLIWKVCLNILKILSTIKWDVSKVTNMKDMFYYATSFNQPLNWDVINVTTIRYVSLCNFINQLLNWDAKMLLI